MARKIFALVAIFIACVMVSGNVIADGSKEPIDLGKVSAEDRDKQILRMGIIAEYDAVSLYEQLAASATDPAVKKLMLDVAKEEKTHVGEFQALLTDLDKEQLRELKEGEDEVRKLLKR